MARCTVSNNTMSGYLAQDYFGGGVYLRSGGEVRDCDIVANHAYRGGGLYFYYGGAAWHYYASNNTATTGAGRREDGCFITLARAREACRSRG